MRRAEVMETLREFCSVHFMDYQLRDDENIFSLGFVNSMFALQLVEFIESDFEISVEAEDLEIENFSTLNAIADLVQRKTHRSEAA